MTSSKLLSQIRLNLAGYTFVFPAIILVSVFLLYPIGFVVYISFHKWGILGVPQFVGWDNYVTIFKDDKFWQAVSNTVYYAVLAVPAQIGLGLLLAVLVNKKNIFARDVFRTVFFIPLAVSFVAAGIVFSWIFTTTPLQGFVSTLFGNLGIPFLQWQTTDGAWAMVVIVIMNTWKSAGYAMVIYLAGLQGINSEYYEAAQIDGVRNDWQMFRYVSWPLLAPTTFLLVISTMIFTVRGFEPIFVMTQGGPVGATTTLVYYVYRKFPNTMGISSAASTFLLIAIMLLTLAQYWANRRKEAYY
ncbi:MAG: sugar ABC transporter permease [Gallionella sp.]|nr:sugar ABC transporter permease [Gallionella sp.]